MADVLLKFRDQITAQSSVPRWLRGFWAMRFLYAIGLQIDALGDLLKEGVKARIPSFCPSATPYISRDRGITRGPEETTEQICERLRTWQQDATVKGSPISIFRQLQAYLVPHKVRMRLVNNSGYYFEAGVDGEISFGRVTWNWDGKTLPTRFWLILWVPADLWVDDGTFGDDGDIGDGGTIGSTASPSVVAGVRHIIHTWSCENSLHINTILVFDNDTWEVDLPTDGTWGKVSERNPNACYWLGDT